MTQAWRAPGMARQLPIAIPPAAQETTGSYLRRLAEVNHIAVDELKIHLGLNPTVLKLRLQPRNLARLATVTGYSREHLVRALPQLANRHVDSTHLIDWPLPACPACTRHHRGGRVIRYYPSYFHACPKHRIWLSDNGYRHHALLNIAPAPVILAAHTKHRRLARRYSPQSMQYAFHFARKFWDYLDETPPNSGISERLAILRPDSIRFLLDDPEYLAATYPNVMTTAALLVSPHWRRIASRHRTVKQFLAELGRRITGEQQPYWPLRNKEPIAIWIDGLTRTPIDWKSLRPPRNAYLPRTHWPTADYI